MLWRSIRLIVRVDRSPNSCTAIPKASAPQERGSDQIGSPCGPTRGSVRMSHLFSTCDEEREEWAQQSGAARAAAQLGEADASLWPTLFK